MVFPNFPPFINVLWYLEAVTEVISNTAYIGNEIGDLLSNLDLKKIIC